MSKKLTPVDARKFIVDNWGDTKRLAEFMKRYGHAVGLPTINRWLERDSIPGNTLFLLIGLLEIEKGEPVSMAAWLR